MPKTPVPALLRTNQKPSPRQPQNLGLPKSASSTQLTVYRDGVWDLTPYWGYLQWIAHCRDQQKSEFESSRYWNRSAHLIGVAGEFVFAQESGLPIDELLKIDGDGGNDFLNAIQVKTSTNANDPTLKELLNPKHGWSAYYALVKLDTERKWARYLGWCTGETLRNGATEDYGLGARKVIRPSQLISGMPPCIPPIHAQEYRGWF